jgi:hypothetical protein
MPDFVQDNVQLPVKKERDPLGARNPDFYIGAGDWNDILTPALQSLRAAVQGLTTYNHDQPSVALGPGEARVPVVVYASKAVGSIFLLPSGPFVGEVFWRVWK